jgi:hypothetical protein
MRTRGRDTAWVARPGGKNASRIAAAPASRQNIREIERKLAA